MTWEFKVYDDNGFLSRNSVAYVFFDPPKGVKKRRYGINRNEYAKVVNSYRDLPSPCYDNEGDAFFVRDLGKLYIATLGQYSIGHWDTYEFHEIEEFKKRAQFGQKPEEDDDV